MMKIENRTQYFAIKHHYLFFASLLILFRIINIVVILFLLVLSSLVSIMQQSNEWLHKIYDTTSQIAPIVLPILIICWIVVKIINVLFKKNLSYYKKKLDITDEI